MHILFLSRWYPFPANNGSRIRILNLLKGISRVHSISLISFYDPAEGIPDTNSLGDYCSSVKIAPRRDFNPREPNTLLGLFSPTPRSVLDTYSNEIDELIRRELKNNPPEIIIASQFDMAVYAPIFDGTPAIFEEAEVGVYVDRVKTTSEIALKLRHGLTWWKHSQYVSKLLDNFSACTVVSEPEKSLILNLKPDFSDIVVIPNGVDLSVYPAETYECEPDTLIFTGSFRYQPNYAAMEWFIKKVLPHIYRTNPNSRLTITGDTAGYTFNDLHIHQTGYVEDIHPYIARSWISIAPIWEGGGTRVKILESMALRTPIVSTPKGAEGLGAVDGEHLLIAETPEAFAEACVRILNDASLRQRLANQAYEFVQKHFDWGKIVPDYLTLLERVYSKNNQLLSVTQDQTYDR